jgi:8-oxo-dGTP diphosphatase
VDALNPDDAPGMESATAEPDAPIRAAGGVVCRDGPDGTEVVLVHRPRFNDWSLPKGKLKAGEHPLAGAVREVREETGVSVLVGPRLPTERYDVWSGDSLVEKSVDYWAMTSDQSRGSTFRASHEVDDIVWMPVKTALSESTYPHDKRVLRAFAELPALQPPIVFIRHASAGKRDRWSGPDEQRPLDEIGQRQARALAPLLALFGPQRLVSAEPLRCQLTLQPLAKLLGLPVEVDARFTESANPTEAVAALRDLAGFGAPAVVCSQAALIPPVVSAVSGGSPARYHVAKADGWVLSFSESRLAALDGFLLAN